ncbi:MAG: endonuclease [Bacteroidales bacterium]|nr:endonuclease [Bacteroidales bacterium]MCF8389087.1 endonuclease [Bacteroidales bacterium]
MRYIFYILFFLPLSLLAQIPTGYYDSAEGLKAEELKTALHNIIKGHTAYPYSGSSTDIWDILKVSDRDPNNSANVILFYTGWSVNAAQEYNNNTGWNREHVWAKSHGAFDEDDIPGRDAHHLRPTDITVNSKRDSRWFDNGGVAYTDPDGATGCFYSDANYTWEPRAAVKGDVARIIFYMATRYEGENGDPDLEVIDYFPADDHTSEPVHALLSTLLEWHDLDPVDDFEKNRNDVIYSYQHNRNPFIDRPEFVDYIYRDNTGIPKSNSDTFPQYSIYPNPAKDVLKIPGFYQGSKEIYDALGKLILQTEGNEISIESLKPGLYFIKLSGQDNSSHITKFMKQ